jgi:N-hydroxyarylamine O-acetyltransferase
VRVLTAQRRDATGVDSLKGLVLKRAGDGATSRTLETEAEWTAALADLFGLVVDDDRRDALWGRLATAHEAWVAGGRP